MGMLTKQVQRFALMASILVMYAVLAFGLQACAKASMKIELGMNWSANLMILHLQSTGIQFFIGEITDLIQPCRFITD